MSFRCRVFKLTIACVTLAIGTTLFPGCDSKATETPTTNASSDQQSKRDRLEQDYQQAMREAEKNAPEAAVLQLPALADWQQTETRALPTEDHGFSVGYNHSLGITVTFYQFTRGQTSIVDDLNSQPVQLEMEHVKSSIGELVQHGYYESAEESEAGTKAMGASIQNACWSRFKIKVEGEFITSDTYVWACKNRLLKLRCTGLFDSSAEQKKALDDLLTAFGNACNTEQK